MSSASSKRSAGAATGRRLVAFPDYSIGSVGGTRGRWPRALPLDRQRDGDPRAPVHLALDLDLAAERDDEPLGHREEKARAGERAPASRTDRTERPEDAALLLRSEADPVVGDGEDDFAVALVTG